MPARGRLERRVVWGMSGIEVTAAALADGRVELDPFEPLDDDTSRAVDDEAERLAAFRA
jgi:hypothetical protein